MTTVIVATKRGSEAIVAGLGKIQHYDLTIPTEWTAIGLAIDLTDDFTTIDSIQIGGGAAILGVLFQAVIPLTGVAITNANVLITAHWGNDATGALTAVPDSSDIDAGTPLTITVIGKPAGAI
ncbi:hypothetical protein KAR91_53325 [Candidatus Pacearchaeota archaeon]|nr:hypothetical protein [Candidatus Pacearchaeota archaeon]